MTTVKKKKNAGTSKPVLASEPEYSKAARRIYVDLPDADNRMKILRIFLAKENLEPGFKYNELANVTEGYSGSDLKNLCIAAAYRPVQELLAEENKVHIGSQGECLLCDNSDRNE
ncbi:hypothetical protein GIB67_023635 [Kingdonia uniflora]|uniref:AAA ATPase AAA+ lid domain-containing protein n=1 Tax=Kingdonia uniflora TaxID=39325 RepID=A0A7J7L4Y2_9MAGN|nr:hypothetical protein GIB67_023635 [Kingdonia uniflora]